jgi:hypothetical protein
MMLRAFEGLMLIVIEEGGEAQRAHLTPLSAVQQSASWNCWVSLRRSICVWPSIFQNLCSK